MKKIILTKTNEDVPKSIDCSSTTLLDRKLNLPNYKKLFEALFEIPDKKVVARVFDAINNRNKYAPIIEIIEVCSKCNQGTPKITKADASTQTEDKIKMENVIANTSDDSRDTLPVSLTAMPLDVQTAPKNEPASMPQKRKRRRKIQLPQVIKKSLAEVQQKRDKPVLQKRKPNVSKTNDSKKHDSIQHHVKRQRRDSASSSTSNISALFDEKCLEEPVSTDEMKNMMLEEWMKCECIEPDGLLPIHSAIVKNDEKFLGRQILVWKFLKHTDLNELLTENDEDCLQLALAENSSTEIVKMLLSNGLDANCRDEKSNTIIHLAILNEAETQVVELLMEKIDMKTLFSLNNDGYSALHLAARQNNFMLAEALLDAFDKRLLGKTYYNRERKRDEKHFLKYYESCCERYKLQTYFRRFSKENFAKKQKLMDAGDLCSGDPVLFYTIKNKSEHLIYFLLAHLADPRTASLSGQSPSSFLNEYSKSLNLSLRIDQVMENVIFLLNK